MARWAGRPVRGVEEHVTGTGKASGFRHRSLRTSPERPAVAPREANHSGVADSLRDAVAQVAVTPIGRSAPRSRMAPRPMLLIDPRAPILRRQTIARAAEPAAAKTIHVVIAAFPAVADYTVRRSRTIVRRRRRPRPVPACECVLRSPRAPCPRTACRSRALLPSMLARGSCEHLIRPDSRAQAGARSQFRVERLGRATRPRWLRSRDGAAHPALPAGA